MKKLILAFGLCTVLSSCEETPFGGPVWREILVKHYVIKYVDVAGLSVRGLSCNSKQETYIEGGFHGGPCYYAPELDLNKVQNASEKFLELATRNGDTEYKLNRSWEAYDYDRGPYASSEHFSGIEVVCANAAWDDAHPAGTSLNDLMRLSFTSYYDFVQSGYATEKLKELSRVRKPLSELAATDLWMLGGWFGLYFDCYPTSGSYELKVTLTTVDGVKRSGTCTVVF